MLLAFYKQNTAVLGQDQNAWTRSQSVSFTRCVLMRSEDFRVNRLQWSCLRAVYTGPSTQLGCGRYACGHSSATTRQRTPPCRVWTPPWRSVEATSLKSCRWRTPSGGRRGVTTAPPVSDSFPVDRFYTGELRSLTASSRPTCIHTQAHW